LSNDNDFVVVHNGIVENFLELKKSCGGRRCLSLRHRHGNHRSPGRAILFTFKRHDQCGEGGAQRAARRARGCLDVQSRTGQDHRRPNR
jgi:hypothetical protein